MKETLLIFATTVLFVMIGFVFGLNYGVGLSMMIGPNKACNSLRINILQC